MPFTGSHPAAILPLRRLGVPVSALVLGSVAPDLPYYLPLPVTAAQTHTLAGAFGATLLLGLVAYLVWHLVLVQPLVWALPASAQGRIPAHWRTGLAGRLTTAGGLARVSLGLALGAITHVVWDAFTHAGMWGVDALPWLATDFGGLALHRWLHLGSSLAGLVVLAWYAARWWRTAPLVGAVDPISPALRWAILGVLLGWAGWSAVRVGLRLLQYPGAVNVAWFPVETLVGFLSTLLVGLLAAAATWHAVVWMGGRTGHHMAARNRRNSAEGKAPGLRGSAGSSGDEAVGAGGDVGNLT